MEKDHKFRSKGKKKLRHQPKVEQIHTKMGAFKNGEPFLLLGHPLEQSSVRLLCPEHLPLEHNYFLFNVLLGLLLHL